MLSGCVYEVLAITTRKFPTVTKLCHIHRNNPVGRAGIIGALGILAWHLLLEQIEDALVPEALVVIDDTYAT